jgi:hypothetical protein
MRAEAKRFLLVEGFKLVRASGSVDDSVEDALITLTLAAEFESFLASTHPFAGKRPSEPSSKERKLVSQLFWKGHKTEAPFLSIVGLFLCSVAPSSASVERSFQIQGDAQRSDRPRLSQENAEAESFIRMNKWPLKKEQYDPDACESIAETDREPNAEGVMGGDVVE